MSGFFFSLEGIDGVGKTTQAQLLAEWLRQCGWQVTTCRDPGGTPAGDRIRRILLDPELAVSPMAEMLLFQASRALLAEQVIRPAWARGEIVISDRFLLSTVVYQGYAGGLDPEEIWHLGERATEGMLPMRTWVLDMPAELALQRCQRHGEQLRDRIEARGLAYLERVRQGFLIEAQRKPDQIRIVDANRDSDLVAAELRQEVALALELDPRS